MKTWKLTLTVEGPVLTKSTAPGACGLDAVAARTADGHPCLPWSLLTGRLRQAWEELGLPTAPLGPDPVSGRDGGGGSNEPQRATLRFTDFVCRQDLPLSSFQSRAPREPETGAVRDRALLAFEQVFASGARPRFEGIVQAEKADADLQRNLEFGLRWISHLGAFRSCGFGRLIGHDLEEVDAPEEASTADEFKFDDRSVMGVRLTLLDPFCFARRRTADNVFESADIIPGAALKAVLADRWKASNESLPGWFNRLRITHAFPAPDTDSDARPVALPISLVMDEAENWYDSTLQSQPFLLSDGGIPRYAGGWKESKAASAVQTAFGWASPSRSLRLRTAIDRATQRAADDHLFAQELIDPTGCIWLCRVDASALTDEEKLDAASRLSSAFKEGLRGLGKTKARARTAPANVVEAQTERHQPPGGTHLVLTLQTPAVLLDPRGLDAPENRTPAAIRRRYEKAFAEALPETTLVHYFSTQSLAGGQYYWRRFQHLQPYNPWLLTDAGSVFVFECSGGGADALAEKWHGKSLPLPPWTTEAYGLAGTPERDWEKCPFLPENGYGEVAANLACHWRKALPNDIKLLTPLP